MFSLASFDDRLEDDDFDLIEENLGVKVKRGVSAFFVSVLEDEGRSPGSSVALGGGGRHIQNHLGNFSKEKVAQHRGAVEPSSGCLSEFQEWALGHHLM